MSPDTNRSEEVIANYKQRKLAHSALHHIHALVREFEKDAAFDRKVALIGVVLLVALVAVSVAWLFSGMSTTLS